MTRLGFLIILAITLFFSLYSPLGSIEATPKFWRDEAIPFEVARTLVELGTLDIVVAPGVVAERPYLTHATGFPVTVPLAGVFKIFGVGVFQSRLYMLGWIIATITTLFFVVRSFFGLRAAIVGTLLVTTFSPFYANGKTSTGEIPGFLFLTLALYFLYNNKRKRYMLGGFFLALAAVTKPSIYLLVFPAYFLQRMFFDRTSFIYSMFKVALGAVPIILLWIYIILPQPFAPASWHTMIELYRNPFNESSLLSRFPSAVWPLLTHSTIIYFTLLSFLAALAYQRKSFQDGGRHFAHFVFFYGAACVIYFLRSPGWLRFLLPFELFVLVLAYPSLKNLFKKNRLLPTGLIAFLLLAQVINFFFYSNIYSSTENIDVAYFINTKLLADGKSTIGIIYSPTVAALISPHQKYQITTIGGANTFLGQNPLSLPPESLPTYIFGSSEEYTGVLTQYYEHYIPKNASDATFTPNIFRRK